MKKEAEVKRAEFMKERLEYEGKRVLCELLSRKGQLKATPLKSKPLESIKETAPWRRK